MIAKFFKFKEYGSDLKTEVLAGIVTFMAMAYIIVVQPAVLSQAGMDFGSVMVATCLSSAIATLLMGIYANYPIALAPGMGQNFYFTFTVVLGMGIAWQSALGAVFISGVIFIVLSLWRVREKLINAIPETLQYGIAAGIGFFIAFIGFLQAGIIKKSGLVVSLGNFHQKEVLLSVIGLFITGILIARKIKGGILLGMVITGLIGLAMGLVEYQGIAGKIPSISPTFMKMDVVGAIRYGIFTVIFVFLFMDVFDTVGTVIGIGQAGGFMKDGKLPRAERILFSDAVGTVAGAMLGTSTVTSYIESAAGVSSGGKTGFASVITAICFLLALFFYPFVRMVGTGIPGEGGITLYPVTAPALIIIGSLIMGTVKKIKWEDHTESIPAFLTLLGIPLTYNIGDGMAMGFISYVIFKLTSGRYRELNWILIVIAVLFIFKYAVLIR
ncbi:MAG: NCS2 family permease [bacterium]|nr:NCS2 family permease [bacterium]